MLEGFKEENRVAIMGIINVNDDSFSGDGSLDHKVITEQIKTQILAGADIIDLGAESARTNRRAITEEEEARRLFSVLEHWADLMALVKPRDAKQIFPPLLSVNTWRPKVIKRLMDSPYASQISLLNDMSALAYPETLEIIKDTSVNLLIMHSVGLPKECHADQRWADIVKSVQTFFSEKIEMARLGGVAKERLILDPGLDFAKTPADSLALIHAAESFMEHEVPLLYPLSRKHFIGEALGIELPSDRDAGTVACLPFLATLPACIVRVHNVDAVYTASRVLSAL